MDRKLKLEIEELEERIAPAPALALKVDGLGLVATVDSHAVAANGHGPVVVTEAC